MTYREDHLGYTVEHNEKPIMYLQKGNGWNGILVSDLLYQMRGLYQEWQLGYAQGYKNAQQDWENKIGR